MAGNYRKARRLNNSLENAGAMALGLPPCAMAFGSTSNIRKPRMLPVKYARIIFAVYSITSRHSIQRRGTIGKPAR